MSSIWTPGGERPVPPPGQPVEEQPEPTEAEMRAQLEAMQQELANAPASVVVANHAFGLFELAALHLSIQPPKLDQASLAIDAMAAIVEGLAGRLDEAEAQLKEALAQLRMAFVQIKAASLGTGDGPSDN